MQNMFPTLYFLINDLTLLLITYVFFLMAVITEMYIAFPNIILARAVCVLSPSTYSSSSQFLTVKFLFITYIQLLFQF